MISSSSECTMRRSINTKAGGLHLFSDRPIRQEERRPILKADRRSRHGTLHTSRPPSLSEHGLLLNPSLITPATDPPLLLLHLRHSSAIFQAPQHTVQEILIRCIRHVSDGPILVGRVPEILRVKSWSLCSFPDAHLWA